MVRRGQVVALPSVVIPPENTPEKLKSASLVANPVWKYAGPGDKINFEWQIGLWNSTFNGITDRKYSTQAQPASTELKEFTTDLPAIPLSALIPGDYDCEIWLKDGFADLRVIVENCVRIIAEALQVIVALKNPPSGATLWTLSLCDWPITTLMHFAGWGEAGAISQYLDITKEATFEIPEGLTFPLRIVALQICKWNADRTALIELYYVQSYKLYLWDWEKGGYGTQPDPTYRAVFIPALGNYSYNVAAQRFESA